MKNNFKKIFMCFALFMDKELVAGKREQIQSTSPADQANGQGTVQSGDNESIGSKGSRFSRMSFYNNEALKVDGIENFELEDLLNRKYKIIGGEASNVTVTSINRSIKNVEIKIKNIVEKIEAERKNQNKEIRKKNLSELVIEYNKNINKVKELYSKALTAYQMKKDENSFNSLQKSLSNLVTDLKKYKFLKKTIKTSDSKNTNSDLTKSNIEKLKSVLELKRKVEDNESVYSLKSSSPSVDSQSSLGEKNHTSLFPLGSTLLSANGDNSAPEAQSFQQKNNTSLLPLASTVNLANGDNSAPEAQSFQQNNNKSFQQKNDISLAQLCSIAPSVNGENTAIKSKSSQQNNNKSFQQKNDISLAQLCSIAPSVNDENIAIKSKPFQQNNDKSFQQKNDISLAQLGLIAPSVNDENTAIKSKSFQQKKDISLASLGSTVPSANGENTDLNTESTSGDVSQSKKSSSHRRSRRGSKSKPQKRRSYSFVSTGSNNGSRRQSENAVEKNAVKNVREKLEQKTTTNTSTDNDDKTTKKSIIYNQNDLKNNDNKSIKDSSFFDKNSISAAVNFGLEFYELNSTLSGGIVTTEKYLAGYIQVLANPLSDFLVETFGKTYLENLKAVIIMHILGYHYNSQENFDPLNRFLVGLAVSLEDIMPDALKGYHFGIIANLNNCGIFLGTMNGVSFTYTHKYR